MITFLRKYFGIRYFQITFADIKLHHKIRDIY